MIVAVIAVRMVEMTFDQIVDVIAVRHGLMAAARAMYVPCRMPGARMLRSAGRWIGGSHRQHMLDDRAVAVGVMKMTVVQVIDVTFVLNGGMPAIRTVLMFVMSMYFTGMCHSDTLSY